MKSASSKSHRSRASSALPREQPSLTVAPGLALPPRPGYACLMKKYLLALSMLITVVLTLAATDSAHGLFFLVSAAVFAFQAFALTHLVRA